MDRLKWFGAAVAKPVASFGAFLADSGARIGPTGRWLRLDVSGFLLGIVCLSQGLLPARLLRVFARRGILRGRHAVLSSKLRRQHGLRGRAGVFAAAYSRRRRI